VRFADILLGMAAVALHLLHVGGDRHHGRVPIRKELGVLDLRDLVLFSCDLGGQNDGTVFVFLQVVEGVAPGGPEHGAFLPGKIEADHVAELEVVGFGVEAVGESGVELPLQALQGGDGAEERIPGAGAELQRQRQRQAAGGLGNRSRHPLRSAS
ncbi:MAG: hypothetical protein RQ722_09075, partial [Desulfuromonadales bacterium]|nr:hypothetical protein [Desulfuromonadales bacterium]